MIIETFRRAHQALHDRGANGAHPLTPADRVALFRRVFDSEDGERVLVELAIFTGVFTSIPPVAPSESLRAVEAKREVFFDIIRELTAIPNEDGSVDYIHDHQMEV